MPIINFYHPEDNRLIATIKAMSSEEARIRFGASIKSGTCIKPSFLGELSENEVQYLYFDQNVLREGLLSGNYEFEEQNSEL